MPSQKIMIARVELKPHHEALIRAAGAAHRDAKRLREQARYADRSMAKLEEAIYGFFGIEYKNVKRETEVVS